MKTIILVVISLVGAKSIFKSVNPTIFIRVKDLILMIYFPCEIYVKIVILLYICICEPCNSIQPYYNSTADMSYRLRRKILTAQIVQET